MNYYTKRQVEMIESMTPEAKEKYFATARKVTVGTYGQLIKEPKPHIKNWCVAKIRGVTVCEDSENWKFETPEEARESGRRLLEFWQAKYNANEEFITA